MQAGKVRRSPFEVTVGTPYGAVDVAVDPRRTARIRCPSDPRGWPVPLCVGGATVVVSAELARVDGSWAPRSWNVSTWDGAGADAVRGPLLGALSEALDGLGKLFVERDLVEVLRARKARLDEIAAIEKEIARREAKIRDRRQALAVAEMGYASQEARLRREIESLDVSTPPGVAGRGMAPGRVPAGVD